MTETNDQMFMRMYGARRIHLVLQFHTPLVWCPMCEKKKRDVMRRRQNTSYFNEALNWVVCCNECFDEIEQHWADLWAEYYANCY